MWGSDGRQWRMKEGRILGMGERAQRGGRGKIIVRGRGVGKEGCRCNTVKVSQCIYHI